MAGSEFQAAEAEELADDLALTIRHIAERLPALYGPADGGPDIADTTLSIGEWACTDDRAERIALLRGGLQGSGPLMTVHTTVHDAGRLAAAIRYGDQGEPGSRPRDDDELPRLLRHRPTHIRRDIELLVDGLPIRFALCRGTVAWYAWAQLPSGVGLVVEAAGIDPQDVRIVQVTDLTAYLEGQRAMIQRAWAERRSAP